MNKSEYEQLHPRCCLSFPSLQWAAQRIGPAFTYDLLIHPSMTLEIQYFLKRHMLVTSENPLAPYVNVVPCPDLAIEEWYLRANDKAVGSVGVR